jgi:hypothetical protein
MSLIYGIHGKILNLIKEFYEDSVHSVAYFEKKSNPIFSTVGVKQGCTLSPTLFVVLMDFIMRIPVQNKYRGIHRGLQDRLEDLDFTDDICLLSSSFKDMESKINELVEAASEFNLKINANKITEMRINTILTKTQIIKGQGVEEVDKFQYSSSLVTKPGSSETDVVAHTTQANNAFIQLWSIWKSSHLSFATKLCIFNTNVN